MPIKGQLIKREKVLKEKKLDKALERLQGALRGGKIVDEDVAWAPIIMITAILVQFVRDAESINIFASLLPIAP